MASLGDIHLSAERFEGMGLDLADLQVRGTRGRTGWEFDIRQRDLDGRVLVPHATGQPLEIDLQRLRFAGAQGVAEESSALVEPIVAEDPLRSITPSSLPAVNLSIAELFLGRIWSARCRFACARRLPG